jgi:enoyl-CoA hydratase
MQSISDALRSHAAPAASGTLEADRPQIDEHFGAEDLSAIVRSLETADGDWAEATRRALGRHSPLMMAVTLEQVRRARAMSLAEDLRMERDMVRHCFHLRRGAGSETVEGIRALAVDKDRAPRWNPATVAEVTPAMVQAFFVSPWPAWAHPLRHLS